MRERFATRTVCIYAYSMEIGRLVVSAKDSAGLSIRKLSRHAQVAGSTITRIQAGAVDPSVQTLERIFEAAGFDLHIAALRHGTPHRPRLSALSDAWARANGRLRLDWPRWRALLDELARHPELTPEAIYEAPPPAGEPIVDTLLAAIAEKLADDAQLPRPAWTVSVPALHEPYEPPIARVMTEREIPSQFRERGVSIDAQSLWRDRSTVGV